MRNNCQINYFFEKHNLKKEYMDSFEKLYPYMKEIIDEKQSVLYENILFFKMIDLSGNQKLELIDLFISSYFNTAIAKSKFSPEFVTITSAILEGLVPIKLEYLCVEEIYDEIYNIISKRV